MIGVFTDKEVTLNFGLDIEGNKSLPEARMVLALDSGLSISIKAKINEKVAKVTIPPLKHLLKNTESKLINSHLEVIADGAYFIPWKDQCELKESINVQVKEDVEINQKTEYISISVSPLQSDPEPMKEEIKEEVKEEKLPFKVSTSFKESVPKKLLADKWNEYKKIKTSKDLNINSVYATGYFEGLDTIIKTLKPFMETLTLESAHSKVQSLMKSAVELKEKADADESQYNKEFYEGYYSAIVDTFISI